MGEPTRIGEILPDTLKTIKENATRAGNTPPPEPKR